MLNHRKRKAAFLSLVLLITCYLLWTQRPVTIIRAGSHAEYDPGFVLKEFASKDRKFEAYGILVDHLALTEWGRIHWYLDHKEELKNLYHIPSSDGYNITFWDIGDGFTDFASSGDGDMYCLPQIKETEKHCVEKNMLMSVDYEQGYYEKFSFSKSEYYWITMPDGKLVRIKNAL